MRRLPVLILAVLLVGALAPPARTDTAKLMLVRARPADARQAAYLMGSFDETHNHGDGYIELLLWPGDAARLASSGIAYEVISADLVARDAASARGPQEIARLPGPDRDDYRHLPDYERELKALARKHPQLVRLLELREPTLEGRTVYGVEIAAGGPDGRPTFYVDGIHHAREWPAAEYPMIFAHDLVERFGRDARITRLLRDVTVVIVPVVNPDGFDYSRESPVQNPWLAVGNGFEGYWRKNRRSLTGVTVPGAQKNPDAYGVDPNRNYALLWGEDENGSSSVPVYQTYRGSAPFSEPETRNVRAEILRRNVTGVITNHTYGNLVLRPWGHTSADAPDERILEALGQRLADAMGGYRNQKGIGLYATHGTTDDWAYGAIGALGYTLEHGNNGFHPPYGDSVARSWRGVIEAFVIMAEAAAEPRYHSVLTGRVVDARGRRVRAKLVLTKAFATPLGEGNPTGEEAIDERVRLTITTGRDGRFEWHVNPSTRPIPEVKGKESYALKIDGCTLRRITVDRGERLDLGTLERPEVCVMAIEARS